MYCCCAISRFVLARLPALGGVARISRLVLGDCAKMELARQWNLAAFYRGRISDLVRLRNALGVTAHPSPHAAQCKFVASLRDPAPRSCVLLRV